MRLTAVTSIIRHGDRWIHAPRGMAWLAGLLLGGYLLSWYQQFLTAFGTSLTMTTALVIAAATGLQLGHRADRIAHGSSGVSDLLTSAALAAWTVIFGGLIVAVSYLVGYIPLASLASPGGQFLFAAGAAIVLIGVPMFLIARLAGHFPIRPFLNGLAVGLAVAVFFLAPTLGVRGTGFLAAIIGGIILLDRVVRGSTSPARKPGSRRVAGVERSDPPAIRGLGIPSGRSQPRPEPFQPAASPGPRFTVRLEIVWKLLVVSLCGAAFAVVGRLLDQVMPAAGYVVFIRAAAVLPGLAFGLRWAGRRLNRGDEHSAVQSWGGLSLAAWLSLMLAGFPMLISLILSLNSSVSLVPLHMAALGLIAVIACFPIGWAWGVVIASPSPRGALLADCHPLAAAIGYLLMRWCGGPLAEVGNPAVIVSGLLLLAAAGRWAMEHRIPRRLAARLAVISAVCVAVAVPWCGSRYDPARAAQLLFSTTVFMAKRSGIEFEMLTSLDEARTVAVVEGEAGTYTLMKYRGSQLQLRDNGIPKGVVSTNPDLCPQYSAEVMQAVMPLVLHERPRKVLLLGLSSGVPLTTCLAFPVEELTCVEADAGLIDLMRRTVWPASGVDPLRDERLDLMRIDPVLAVACHGDRYNVIISSPDSAALLKSAGSYTVEFYRHAASRLTADGIYCQRFRQIDYGPRPLRIAVRSMQTVFRAVAAIETAPGEILLLGTNASEGLARRGLLDRLQSPQVRTALAQVGWDWSVLLNLAAYNPQQLREFVQADKVGPNTVGNGHFTFGLPQEMMRWAVKWKEYRQAISSHAGHLLTWQHVDGNDPDVLRRLSEVVGQRRLMAANPDQYWDYRKVVRKQLTDRPRAKIMQVSGELPAQRMHPIDKRRLAYFKELGQAAGGRPVRSINIHRVERFERPYDPFISYFLHQEVAELYSRAEDRDVQRELVHRLHAIYYADARDRSVRDVADAMRLIVEHPESLPDPADRWDQLNALLEQLRARWKARGRRKPLDTQIVMVDIDLSISAAERSFTEMDLLRESLNIELVAWRSRKSFIERFLVRPLRTYRTRLFTHDQNEKRKRKKAARKRRSSGSAQQKKTRLASEPAK